MDDILVINPAEIRNLESTSSVYSFLDYLWMSGSWLAPPKNPNWSGYMELAIKGNTNHQTSKVITLPFVNLPPSSLDAIYTVHLDIYTCLVAFNQPLYVKAVDMVDEKKYS